MKVAARAALFAVVLALVFGGAFAAGSAIDPNPNPDAVRAPSSERPAPAEHDSGPGAHR